MADQSKLCCVIFDEPVIKANVSYNPERVEVEYLGDVGKSKYLTNNSVLFLLRGLACKWKQPIGYFLTSSTSSTDLLKTIVF